MAFRRPPPSHPPSFKRDLIIMKLKKWPEQFSVLFKQHKGQAFIFLAQGLIAHNVRKHHGSQTTFFAFHLSIFLKRSSSYFRDYYIKKRSEGKSHTEAVIATSAKLLRVIHSLLKKDKIFV